MAQSKVVLITGCSDGGIGHYLAVEFAARGCTVYASARNPSKITYGDDKLIIPLELDVTSMESVKAAVAHVVQEAGRIDVLVNNAGVSCMGPMVEVDIERVRQAYDTNVLGVARVCQVVSPHMIRQRSGTIANVGSVVGYSTTPWAGVYASTKSAVHAMSDAMRMELSPFNVHVTVVAPGGIKSHFADNSELELPEWTNYSLAKPAIEARIKYSQVGGVTPTDEFAAVVVGRILADHPSAYITYGNHSTLTWLMYYVPPVLRDRILARRFNTGLLNGKGAGSSSSVSGALKALLALAAAGAVVCAAKAYI
ncbi:NADPH-dependent 1-acyl dihydroxyacetone phosphate reductase [Linderina macrospora]|uniref:NADPH-dependent 1-acyl dihydroxyacetone phosphate reductase n=1 Tax=Linderina macrospora TaxID=4868 RepID=A0ACC1J8H1_9FUNG|nr:NADPH-dependent 1-acyl dihydroxyacetone phosphate reductase [Linderina macrospora]